MGAGTGAAQSRIIVLHTDAGSNAAKRAATASGFTALLAQTQLMRHLAGQPLGQLRGAPAGNARSALISGGGFVAVGDAAQAYDPLSSQGIAQALASGNQAGQALAFALANPDNAPACLERYAQHMDTCWHRYTADYAKYYQLETRWPKAPFWQRRQRRSDFPQPLNARDAS